MRRSPFTELQSLRQNRELLLRVADVIYKEYLSDERANYSVVDRLAIGVSPQAAKFALYELLRGVEVKEEYKDIKQAIENILAGLDDERYRELALDICRSIAILSLSLRFSGGGA